MAMYTALTLTAADGIPAGFIHVPQLATQAAKADRLVASMSLEMMVDGVRVALEAPWPRRAPAGQRAPGGAVAEVTMRRRVLGLAPLVAGVAGLAAVAGLTLGLVGEGHGAGPCRAR